MFQHSLRPTKRYFQNIYNNNDDDDNNNNDEKTTCHLVSYFGMPQTAQLRLLNTFSFPFLILHDS